jgi:ABC-2 type transport system permease protein
MNKFWHVTWHEYSRHVFRRRFIFALLSVPFFIAVTIALVILIIWMQSSPNPVGYVDQSGILANPVSQPPVKFPERMIPMQAYTDEVKAKADLQAGKLQVYYVIPPDFLQSGQVNQFYESEPEGFATEQFNAFLTANLLANQPADIANRILHGNQLLIQSADKTREVSLEGIVNILLPFIAGILFIVAMSTSSGYLLQAVVEEKENRTMEIVVTSISPGQLMSGKILADIGVGITQLAVWGIFIGLVLWLGRPYFSFLSGITISGSMILTLIAVMVPAFIMICGLMAAVGATVTEASEGQQIMALFTIPIWIPYILVSVFIQNPNSPLAIAMSIFPLTAPMSIAMRVGFTTIPSWQVFTSIALLVFSAIGAIWLAGRVFRLGMLRYGQRLRWNEIFSHQRV